MPALVITLGLPASGKSTYARTLTDHIRINRDDLRAMLHSVPWSKERERLTMAARDSLITMMLRKGQNVICDDTNFGQTDWLQKLATQAGATSRIQDFTHIPIELCIERDSLRTGKACVGEQVIRNMARHWLDQP